MTHFGDDRAFQLDRAWVIVDDSPEHPDPEERAQVVDTLFTLSDGDLATRGATSDSGPDAMVLAHGAFTATGAEQQLMAGPWWPAITLPEGVRTTWRVLDLRTGTLYRTARVEHAGSTTDRQAPAGDEGARIVRTVRFASAATPHLVGIRAEMPQEMAAETRGPQAPVMLVEPAGEEAGRWERHSIDTGAAIVMRYYDNSTDCEHGRRIERLVTYAVNGGADRLADDLRACASKGFETLLAEHQDAWRRRWDEVGIDIPDDPEATLAARYGLFHLWGVAASGDQVAIGACGLTGHRYRGHVFWDTDVFALPAVASMVPESARAMLNYRLARLPQAREIAAAAGRTGARFPWESALDGCDVTPSTVVVNGETIEVLTGQLQEHIVADVAWAADWYANWTGDHAWLTERGHPLILETAQYWASRVEPGDDGHLHINDVIGPDEHHEHVDDNAFTNEMARWNLRRGADLLDELHPDRAEEAADWRDLADRIATTYDPATGVYEQYRGFFDLDPDVPDGLGRLPIPEAVKLSHSELQRTRILKQPDVLMLHHMVPGHVPADSLEPNLDLYLPYTSHASSLSPGVTAGTLARAGRTDEALDLLRQALRMDLDDLTGRTRTGLHLASIGGTWQAIVSGFAGISVRAGAVVVDPRLPHAWPRFEIRLRVLGRRIRLTVTGDRARLETDGPIPLHSSPGAAGVTDADVVIVSRAADLGAGDGGWRVLSSD